MATATSTTVDFRARDAAGNPLPGPEPDRTPYWRAVVCPAPLAVGVPFRVTIFAPAPFTVEWPYSDTDGPILATAETQTQRLSLGGRTEIELDYPMDRLVSITAVNDLVDADGDVYEFAGETFFTAHAAGGRLVLDRALRGGVDVEYVAHRGRSFDFPAVADPEEYLLELRSEMLPAPVRTVLHIPGDPLAADDPCSGHGWSGGGPDVPAWDGMIDNFVNGSGFSLTVDANFACNMNGEDYPNNCTPEERDYAVGSTVADGPVPSGATGVIMGGYRTGYLSNIGRADDFGLSEAYTSLTSNPNSPGRLSFINDESMRSTLTLVWDGQPRTFEPPTQPDPQPNAVGQPVSLGGLVTPEHPTGYGFGEFAELCISLHAPMDLYYPAGVAVTVDVWTNSGTRHASYAITTGAENLPELVFPFSEFVSDDVAVDFTQVSALRLSFDGPPGTRLEINWVKVL